MNATAERMIQSLYDRVLYRFNEEDHPREGKGTSKGGQFAKKQGVDIQGTDDLGRQWVEGYNRVRVDPNSASDAEIWRAAVFTEMARRTFNKQSDAGIITEQQRDEVWQQLSDDHESMMNLLRARGEGTAERAKPLFDQPDAAGEPEMGTGSPVGDEPAPSESLGAGVRHLPDGRAIGTTQLTVDQISFDPGRFQYKIEGIDKGVSEKLKDVGTFNPMFAGQLLAWRDPADGKVYVVNGHHRYELAKRTGYQGPLSVYLIDAENAQKARAQGALANLAEGNGTAMDAAKFLKDSGTTVDDLASVGVSLRGSVARDGATLAKLNDRIFYKVASGLESPNRAMAIARHIDDHDLQNEAYDELEQLTAKGKKLTDGDVEEIAREIASDPKTTETQQTLWGDETKTKSLRAERAQIKRKLRTDLEQRMRAFGAVTTGGRSKTLSEVGNVLDDQTNQRMAAQAKEHLWVFDKLLNTKGPINDAITRAAEELAQHPRDSKRIIAQLAELIRPELEAESGGTAGSGGENSAGGGAATAKLFSRSASIGEVIRYRLAGRVQYSDQRKWVTIGGHPGENGEHEGGQAVQIDDDGNVTAGPSWMAERGINDLGDFGRTASQSEQEESKLTRPKGKPSPRWNHIRQSERDRIVEDRDTDAMLAILNKGESDWGDLAVTWDESDLDEDFWKEEEFQLWSGDEGYTTTEFRSEPRFSGIEPVAGVIPPMGYDARYFRAPTEHGDYFGYRGYFPPGKEDRDAAVSAAVNQGNWMTFRFGGKGHKGEWWIRAKRLDDRTIDRLEKWSKSLPPEYRTKKVHIDIQPEGLYRGRESVGMMSLNEKQFHNLRKSILEQYRRDTLKRKIYQALADRLQYRKKHKPAKGQMTLFGDSDWDESKHPRAADGKFTSGPGVAKKGDTDGNVQADGGRSDSQRIPRRPSMGKSFIDLLEEELSRVNKRTRERSAELPDRDSESSDRPDSDADQSGDAADGSGVRGEAGNAPAERGRRRRRALDESTDFAAGNYRYHDESFLDGGVKTKFKQNLAACTVLRDMRLEGRTEATPAEQEILSKFTGWGSMPQLFAQWPKDEWREEAKQLKAVLGDSLFSEAKDTVGDAAIKAAARATLNSHFTSPQIVKAHWEIAQKLGFKGGRFLEPSVGSGFYIGMMPDELASRTSVTASELDGTTASVAKALYPSSNIKHTGFQDLNAPDNFYDLAASNFPFGDYGVSDPKYNKHNARIHDYFFLKSMDAVRPGGLVMGVTSTGTMDKSDPSIRRELAKNADLIAAIRLPAKTHGKAANTEVVTDLIILRKREPGMEALEETPAEAQAEQGFTGVTTDSLGRVYHWVNGKRVPADHWIETTKVPDPDGGEDIEVNKYFADRPEQILGRLDRTGTMYKGDSKNVSPTEDFDALLRAAIDRMPEDIYTDTVAPLELPERIEAPDGMKDGNYVIKDGKVWQRKGAALEKANVAQADVPRMADMLSIRSKLNDLIDADLANEDADQNRADLNEAYDAFVEKYGPIHAPKNQKLLVGDPDRPRLLSLEKYNPDTKKASKTDIFERNVSRPNVTITHAETTGEALGVSLNELGRIDPERMAQLRDMSIDDIESELRQSGLAFEDPSAGWVPKDEYLSGNVREKLVQAKAAAEADPRYKSNVEALEKHQPEDIDYTQITAKLGVPWVPKSDMQDFVRHLTNAGRGDRIDVDYVSAVGKWVTDVKAGGHAADSWTAGGKTFNQIFNAALNGTTLKVFTDGPDDTKVLDVKATEEVAGKISDMKEEFETWLWDNDERRERLHRHYNDNYNNIRERTYDGSHLTFPGLHPDWTVREGTKNFIWQVISRGRGICAHEVGYGKTAAQVISAMELKRLGLARKPAIVVPKATLEQMEKDAQELYPGAKILSTAGVKNAKQRNEVMSQIATGDYDMVIMSHEHLGLLQMAPEVQEQFIREEVGELSNAIEAAQAMAKKAGSEKRDRTVKQLEKRKAQLEKNIEDILAKPKDNALTFEQTGIDTLFVDEAHKFKSLPVYTSKGNISGVPTSKSDRATNMLMKTKWLQEQNGGRGVIFATGTPVANTMAELYNMQRYIQPEELKSRGIEHFDSWANTFGDTETKVEVDLKGGYRDRTRFTKFTNIPELMNIARQDMDVIRIDSLPPNPDGTPMIKRPQRNEHVVIAPHHEGVEAMMKSINARAKEVQGQKPEPGADNVLKITGDGRKGSVDLRLYDPEAADNPNSKANMAVAEVLKRYHDPDYKGSTQLIFSDVGVHATDNGFRLYDDIIDKLVAGGIPREEIADFGKMTDKQRELAGKALRSGKMRIGIGGTDRMGTGLNVQDNLSAMHHLDIPYVPAAIEQRDGRGIRFGNKNESVDIYRYVTEKSLDELSWSIVGNKANFISQVVTDPKAGRRTITEEDTESLTPQQLMAAASGDTRVMKRVNLQQDVRRMQSAQIRHNRDQQRLASDIKRITTENEKLTAASHRMTRDAQHVASQPEPDREAFQESLKAATEKADKHFSSKPSWQTFNEDPIEVGTYRGLKILRGDVRPNDYYRNVKQVGGYLLEGPSGEQYATGDSLQSIAYVARSIEKKAQAAREDVERNLSDQKKISERIGKPFSQEAELKKAKEQLEALEKDMRENEAPGAEQMQYAAIERRVIRAAANRRILYNAVSRRMNSRRDVGRMVLEMIADRIAS